MKMTISERRVNMPISRVRREKKTVKGVRVYRSTPRTRSVCLGLNQEVRVASESSAAFFSLSTGLRMTAS